MDGNTLMMILVMAGVLACVAVAVVLILWLCGKISDAKLARVWKWVCWAVQAAEQLFGPKTGDQKLAWVKETLTRLGVQITDSVLALIEAAVRELTD